MDEKVLLEAVVLAGELMLVSGAEIYRVEDTMNHMLRKSGYQTVETIVLATGIFVTLNDPMREPVTLAKRTPDRSTNINKIYRVNDVSRRFCSGKISIEQAYTELKQIEKEVPYSPLMKAVGTIGVAACFTPIFNGTVLDFFAAGIVGAFLALASWMVKKIKINDFCVSAFSSFVVAFSAMAIQRFLFPLASVDVMIISSIMPLVPGVIFTNAIRDTLNGDYAAGTARMLEAIVVALAVAAGVGFGMVFFRTLGGVLA